VAYYVAPECLAKQMEETQRKKEKNNIWYIVGKYETPKWNAGNP